MTKQIDRNSTVLLVMGTPCEKLSRGVSFQQNPKAKIGMHVEPSNLLFIAHELIITLQKYQIPYMSIAEMVIPFDNSLINQLAHQWGHPTLVNGANFGGASRERYYFCFPPLHDKLTNNASHRKNIIKATTTNTT